MVREWPLPIFPDDVGGCPFEVGEVPVMTCGNTSVTFKVVTVLELDRYYFGVVVVS